MGEVGRGCDLRRGMSGRGVGDWVIWKLEGWRGGQEMWEKMVVSERTPVVGA